MSNEYLNNKVFESIIIRFQCSKKKKARTYLILEDISETHKRVQEKLIDVENITELELAQVNKQEVDKEFSDAQNKLAEAFYTLSQNIVSYAKFNMIDPDDAVQEGVMICFDKVDRFDSRKGKAFNYMTTCILNHFRQLYRTARNYNELKKKYQDFVQLKLDYKIR